MQGFTERYRAHCGEADIEILVRPGTDMDGRFKARGANCDERATINGRLWRFEAV